MPQSLKKLLQNMLNRMGYQITKADANFAEPLRSLPEVDTLIDIGVAEGTPWLYPNVTFRRAILIDPIRSSDSYRTYLSNGQYVFLELALGSTEGEVQIQHNLSQSSKSSILERSSATTLKDDYETITVPLRTLDGVLQEENEGGGSLGIKIDTEGYELEVLMGAEKSLERAEYVLLEASVSNRFEKNYDFNDVVNFMNKRGFKLATVLSAPRNREGMISYLDVCFIREAATS